MHHAVLIFLLLLMFHNCDTSSRFQPTLPRRERLSHFGFTFSFSDFNPHSHEGSDSSFNAITVTLFKFQPTLPRRERLLRYSIPISLLIFQPTLPRRERLVFKFNLIVAIIISTHTPTKGAT